MNLYLQRTREAINQAIAGMSDEQMSRHPKGKWCTAEILEHLALAFGGSARLMQRALDAGVPQARKPTLRDRFITTIVTGCGYIPEGRKAPKHVIPRGMPPAEVRPLILANLEALDAQLSKCEERFGSSVRIADHPILGPLKLDEWRKFHLLHTWHHMKQIARLRAHVG
jgi:DinB superfamily